MTTKTSPLPNPGLTVKEAAARKNCSLSTMYRWFHLGKIQGIRVGRRIYIFDDAIFVAATVRRNKPRVVLPDLQTQERQPLSVVMYPEEISLMLNTWD